MKEYKIPNWWILASILVGMLLSLYIVEQPLSFSVVVGEVGRFLIRMLVAALPFFVCYIFRMIGAGDVKVIALICGYVGFFQGSQMIFFGFLVGAFVSLLKMLIHGSFFSRFRYLITYLNQVYRTKKISGYYQAQRDGYQSVIPLSACLFVGALFYVWMMN